MKDVGIRRVYYTGNDNELICENVIDMISIHISSVSLNIHTNIVISDKVGRCNFYRNMLIDAIKSYKIIKIINLQYFIKYNFTVIFPTYKYLLKKLNNNNYNILFYDENDELIISIPVLLYI
jgi:hypothetical protein